MILENLVRTFRGPSMPFKVKSFGANFGPHAPCLWSVYKFWGNISKFEVRLRVLEQSLGSVQGLSWWAHTYSK
jgi:hypothetical protein